MFVVAARPAPRRGLGSTIAPAAGRRRARRLAVVALLAASCAALPGIGRASAAARSPRLASRVQAAATVPTVPTPGLLTAGDGQMAMTWGAPDSDGGSPIIGYTVTASWAVHNVGIRSRSLTFGSAATAQTFTGLANGTVYQFTFAAVNAVGTGPASPPNALGVPTKTTLATLQGLGLSNPGGLAVDGAGTVYVADSVHNRMVKLPVGGTPADLGFVGLAYPTAAAVDNAGDVYTNSGARVVELPKVGPQVTVGLTGIYPSADVAGVAVDGAGNLYVLDQDNNRVVELPKTGPQVTLGFSGLIRPSRLAVTAGGDVYVLNHTTSQPVVAPYTIEELPKGGAQQQVVSNLYQPMSLSVDGAGDLFTVTAANPGLGQTKNTLTEVPKGGSPVTIALSGGVSPTVVAADGTGNLYLADASSHISELPKGGLQKAMGFSDLGNPKGVAADASGNVYVADSSRGRVTEQAKGGPPVTLAFTGLNQPSHVGVDAAGDVFVNDTSNGMVVELPKGGAQVTLGQLFPSSLAVDSAGDVFLSLLTNSNVVSNSEIIELPKGGSQVTLLAGLTNADGLAVDAAGTIYFSETYTTGPYYQTSIEKLLKAATQLTPLYTGLIDVPGLAVDSSGNLFVSYNQTVGEYPNGDSHGPTPFLVVAGTGFGGLGGVAAGSSGTVYVTDRSAGVVALSLIPGPVLSDAPEIGIASAGNARATIDWFPPYQTGGAPITGYVVTPYVGAAAHSPVTVGASPQAVTVTGLTNGTTYTFKVAAITSAGTGPQSAGSSPVTPAGAAAPGPPTNALATAGNARATVSWTAPASSGASPISGYKVTPWIGAAAQTPTVFGSTVTSQTITGLANGTIYTFTVAATSSDGTGAPSAHSNAVRPGQVPGAPTIGGATSAASRAQVSWTAPPSPGDTPINGYVITPYVGGTALAPVVAGPTATTTVITGLTNGTTYTFKVAATNATGTGPQSAASNATTPITVADPPTIGTATGGSSRATVTWSAPAANGGSAVTGYAVTPSIGSTPQATRTFSSPALSETVTGLTNGTTYTFRVAAINGAGTGALSAVSNPVTPAFVATVPDAPTNVTGVGGASAVTVHWTAPYDGGAPLNLYVVTPFIAGVAQNPLPFNPSTTSAVVTGLANGTVYTFTVTAHNTNGSGPPSAASPPALPPFRSLDSFVQRQSHDLLGRVATSSEVSAEVAALVGGAKPGAYIGSLRRSSDATGNVDPITRLYFAYFVRIPDKTGLSYWIGRKRTDLSVAAISDQFATSAEFINTYGSLSNRDFVKAVYPNVFGRPADQGGLDYWTGRLDAHASRGLVMAEMTGSAEYVNKEAHPVDVAVTWIDLLAASPSKASFDSWVANLTTGGKTVTDLATALLADPRYTAPSG